MVQRVPNAWAASPEIKRAQKVETKVALDCRHVPVNSAFPRLSTYSPRPIPSFNIPLNFLP